MWVYIKQLMKSDFYSFHFTANLTNLTDFVVGLFQQKKCPKGRNCNFLHVFRDPNGLFPDSTPHRADASVARSRQWRWSESPPPQSNKADDKADDKAKRRRLHNSPSQSKSKSSSKRIERRSKPRQGTWFSRLIDLFLYLFPPFLIHV